MPQPRRTVFDLAHAGKAGERTHAGNIGQPGLIQTPETGFLVKIEELPGETK